MTRDELRAEIAQQTEEFLARGGEITVLEYDPTAEREAKVGRWVPMGGTAGEFDIPCWDSEDWGPLDDAEVEALKAEEDEDDPALNNF